MFEGEMMKLVKAGELRGEVREDATSDRLNGGEVVEDEGEEADVGAEEGADKEATDDRFNGGTDGDSCFCSCN